MSMTIDEAISHAREVEEQYNRIVKTNNNGWGFNGAGDGACRKCAEEHHQLAEWLTELKERRAADHEEAEYIS